MGRLKNYLKKIRGKTGIGWAEKKSGAWVDIIIPRSA